MNIQNRLKKIEQQLSTKAVEESEPEICKHPPSMFKLRQEHPTSGYFDSFCPVVAGHCDACGYDDYLWEFYSLTEEQEERYFELQSSHYFWERQDFLLELLNVGFLKHALHPPSPELIKKFTEE